MSRKVAEVQGKELEKLFDKALPHSVELEQNVIGCMVMSPKAVPEVMQWITSPDAFYSRHHQEIYRQALAVFDQTGAVDVTLLVERIRQVGLGDDIDPSYIVECAESTPAMRNAGRYAEQLARLFKLRQIIESAGQTLHDAYHSDARTAEEIIDNLQRTVGETFRAATDQPSRSMAELVKEEIARLASPENAPLAVKTHYAEADEKLGGGLFTGEMTILAARPSMGKTALALNIAEHVACGGFGTDTVAGSPVAVLSCEMTGQALLHRLLAARTGLSASSIRRNDFPDHRTEDVYSQAEWIAKLPINVVDLSAPSITRIKSEARVQVREYGARLIVIDYLQLITSPQQSRENRQVEVSKVSQELKGIAKELRVPVLALAQLNRDLEKRQDKRPRMSDLRESGSLEQDADVIMFLHRDGYYAEQGGEDEVRRFVQDGGDLTRTDLIISKNRNGAKGSIPLRWDAEGVRFQPVEQGAEEIFGD